MIFYLLLLILAVLLDIKEIKNKTKADIIFYVVAIIIVIILGIIYFLLGEKIGIAEYIINVLNLEGM